MYESPTELLEKIQLGEDSTIEFKEIRIPGSKVNSPKKNDIADEIAGFANTDGGVILFGVADNGEIPGIPLEKLETVEEFLRNICTDLIHPTPSVIITRRSLPNLSGESRPIIQLVIRKGIFLHTSPGGSKWRVGSKCTKMPDSYVDRRRQQLSLFRFISFDEQPVPGVPPSVLDQTILSNYPKHPSDDFETAMRKLRFIADDDNGIPCATVGGILFGTNDPTPWFRNAYIDAVAFKGNEARPNYQLDSKRITGPLDKQILTALKFLKFHNATYGIKTPARVEYPQFSPKALFEAIVNAVVHRDYTISGSHIRLFVFSNRIELYSPGGLPNTIDIESISLRQATRNELIASILSQIEVPDNLGDIGRKFLMDQRGWGVRTIIEESLALSKKKPEYLDIDRSEVQLTIYASDPPGDIE